MASCRIVVAQFALLTFLANFCSGFVYFLTPVDVANHYACAANSSLSAGGVAHLTEKFLQLGEITQNYTGNVDILNDKLPPEILQKMRECEALHTHILTEAGGSTTAPPTSETTMPTTATTSNSSTTPDHDGDQLQDLFAQLAHCYKETDLMYFKTLAFEGEQRPNVDEFLECLQNSILPHYST